MVGFVSYTLLYLVGLVQQTQFSSFGLVYFQTPVLGLGLGVDFTFSWDVNNNNENDNDNDNNNNDNDNDNNDNNKNTPHLNFLTGTVLGVGIRDNG